jgi:tetratricopeptide (TPR) repeat protein
MAALWLVGESRGWYHEAEQITASVADKLREALYPIAQGGRDPDSTEKAIVLAEVLPTQANFCVRLGECERAKALCEECLDLLSHAGDNAQLNAIRAEAKVVMGWVFLTWGQNAEAVQSLRGASDLAAAVSNSWTQVRALMVLGYHAWQVGQYGQAEALLEQAIAETDREGDQWHKAWTLHTLAQALVAGGECVRGESAAQESLQIHRQLQDRPGSIHAILALGDVDYILGHHEQAQRHYEEGQAIATEIGSLVLRSWSLSRQGWLSLAIGKPGAARRQLEEGLAMARESHNQWRAVDALVGLGHATCTLGELQRSRGYLYEALVQATGPGYGPEALNALVGLAGVYVQERQVDRAVELLALVIHHPASSQMTRERAERLLSQIEAELRPEGISAAKARGSAKDLNEVVSELVDTR